MQHYSERLRRNFADGDWLTRDEVAKVIEENSGRPLGQKRFVSDIAKRHGWTVAGDKYAPLYQYSEVGSFCIGSPGRRLQENPSPTALRQRKFKERRKQQGDQEMQKAG